MPRRLSQWVETYKTSSADIDALKCRGLFEIPENGIVIKDIIKAAKLEPHFHDGVIVSGKGTHVNAGSNAHDNATLEDIVFLLPLIDA